MKSGFHTFVFTLALLSEIGAGTALAAEQQILGKSLQIRDPSGNESDREVVLTAKESATDIVSYSRRQ